ncbi:Hypothetical protein D9617_27g044880 [Elsinoe fawcettii]|nr:Hypothetical protein D9617_27g044880 [Elsinoe fawcettii]
MAGLPTRRLLDLSSRSSNTSSPLLASLNSARHAPVRTFTTTPRRHASARASSVARASSKTGVKPMATPSLQQKEALRSAIASGRAFDVMGLAPETFITLPLSERPSWLTAFRDRWLWEKARFMARGKMAFILGYFKFWALRTRSPAQVVRLGTTARMRYRLFEWWDFEMWKVPGVAKGLYEEMYKRLADGEVGKLEGKVKSDLMGSLKGRVASRGRQMGTEWRLVRYMRRPRCVGYSVVAPSPEGKAAWEQTFLEQAVVELESLQSVKRTKKVADGKGGKEVKDVSEGPKGEDGWPEPSKVREYVVLQKSIVDGRPGKWQIWGMARPTSVADVKAELRERLGQSDAV